MSKTICHIQFALPEDVHRNKTRNAGHYPANVVAAFILLVLAILAARRVNPLLFAFLRNARFECALAFRLGGKEWTAGITSRLSERQENVQ